MRAVDTNIIVRFLTGDDPAQAQKARKLFGHEPIFISRTVLLETEWVLRSLYGMPVRRIVASLRALAGIPGVTVEDSDLVANAMQWAEGGLDFADALHLAAASGCKGFLTFDRAFARKAARHPAVPVTSP